VTKYLQPQLIDFQHQAITPNKICPFLEPGLCPYLFRFSERLHGVGTAGRAQTAGPAAAPLASHAPAKNGCLFEPFQMKTIIVPRQARDKHSENSKKDAVFRTDDR
jgi:hypothetical protein